MPDREPLDVLEAIHSTRAMRYLKPDPIPDEVLWEILDAAIRGPTGGNVQNWGWLVIRDPKLKRQMADIYRGGIVQSYGYERFGEEQLADGERIVGAGIEHGDVGIDERNRRSVIHLAEHFAEVPVIVVAVLRGVADGRGPGAGGGIYGAVQNLMLAARAHGLGSVLTSSDSAEGLRERLGLPEDARVMAVIPMGYPSRRNFSQPRRRPVEEVAHWDFWGRQHDRPES